MRACLSMLLVLALALAAHAAHVVVDPPVKVLTQKKDKTEIAGDIVAFDDDGFDVRDSSQKPLTVAWKDLEAKNNFEIHESLFAKASGEQWLALAQQLIAMPEGKPFAQAALLKAIKLDPLIKAKVEQAVRTLTDSSPAQSKQIAQDPPQDFPVSSPDAQATTPPDKNAWPPLTEGQTAAAIKVSKAFAEAARMRVHGNLVLYETKFFLFYSDLPNSEAERWSDLLDKMYARLASLFAVREGSNIWRGKALIFVFSEEEDFRKFERVTYFNRSASAVGVCHELPSGDVHIVFFKQPDELDFAHVLVHESTHGFLHRFRTSIHIPSWANEGLADVIATELVPQRGRAKAISMLAAEAMRANGIGNLLTAEHISPWQYLIAQSLCEYMIREDKPGYLAFINGIKDGMTADEALRTKYGETPSRLISTFAESLGVKDVTVGK